MNARIQIKMDLNPRRRAQAKAAELGLSLGEYVRRLIARNLDESNREADISTLFDLGASREPTDVARDKDKMIGEAVWKEHLRNTGNKGHRRAKNAGL
jgi:hypothetical protein